VFSTKIVDHGSRRGNAIQALAQWRHPVALSEALDVLHQATPHVVLPHLHGNQNRQQFACIFCYCQFIVSY
jgi:hypothetical protein